MALYNSGMVEVYPNQVPYDTDILRSNLYNLTGVSALAATALGCGINYGTIVRGFPCVPVSPPGLSVVVGSNQTPDIIMSLQPLNATAYGSLPVDTTPSHQQFKQGFNWGQLTFSTPAPVTTGFSVIHLVQVAFSTQDVNNVSRPYYNSVNPSAPIFNNNFDTRTDLAVVQLKQGIAASSPTPPTPDAGFTALWYVTVTFGQTSIVSGNIAKVSTVEGSPFVTESLTNKISKATADSTYATLPALQTPYNVFAANDSGVSANTYVANCNPAYTGIVGRRVYIGFLNAPNNGPSTLQVNATAAIAIKVMRNGVQSALVGGEMSTTGVYLLYGVSSSVWLLLNPDPFPIGAVAQVTFGPTSNQTIGTSSNSVIEFNSTVLDPFGWWDSGNFWFLPTIQGTYTISGQVYVVSGVAPQVLRVYKNATVISEQVNTVSFQVPAFAVTVNGATDTISLNWSNTDPSTTTQLGYNSGTLVVVPGNLGSFFQIKYEGLNT